MRDGTLAEVSRSARGGRLATSAARVVPSRKRPLDYLVVGGGISGLYAALLLARRGRSVRVIERGDRLGGLSATETFRGIPCDLGSHRLHPDALRQPLFREIDRAEPFLWRPRRGVLVMGDRHVPYPPGVASMAMALGPRASVSLALGLLSRGRQRRAFAGWEGDRAAADSESDLGFERFVVERVGVAAYEAFYRPYAEKVWGVPAAELSQTVAKRRVSSTSPLSLFGSALGRVVCALEGRSPPRLDQFVYPSGGIGTITRYLERALAEQGVPIERGASFDPFARRAVPALFAGELASLVPTALEHRGLYLVYLALPVARASAAETYYTPDARYWFGRVSELQNYSPELRREGETIVCVEIPEGSFGRSVDFARGARLEALVRQLADARIVPSGTRPIEARQLFVPGVYPIYRRGWLREWRETFARVAALRNVLPFGRQALFLHCNLDHCADIAEMAVRHVEGGGDAASFIRSAERYQDLRVRD